MRPIFLFVILFSYLSFVLKGNDSFLRFIHFEYPENISISSKTDLDHFRVIGKIEYGYTGDWMGGCSRDKDCDINRDHEIYAILSFLDNNKKELYRINYPEMIHYFTTYIQSDENFVFREDLAYSEEFPLLFFEYSEQKKLKKLIRSKKVTKIQVELLKVIVNWTYKCDEFYWKVSKVRNPIELEGKYEFQINKTYTINVKYEEQ
jgi:hypothetical protein